MKSFEFVGLVYSDALIYLLCLVPSVVLYFVVYKRYFISIFDPLMISVVFSLLGFNTVMFLKATGNISDYYFMVYLATQISFFVGFLLVKPVTVSRLKRWKGCKETLFEIQFATILFLGLSITYFVLQGLIFTIKGLPILAESRLNVIGDDILFQIIQRIISIIYLLVVFLTFYFLFQGKTLIKIYAKFSLALLLLFSIFLGSKSAFLSIASVFFVFALFSLKAGDYSIISLLFKHSKKIFIFSLAAAVSVVVLAGDSTDALYFIFYRLIVSGDIYYMSFPNGVIENFISNRPWFETLLGSPLVMLGFMDRSQLPISLGFEIMRFHEGYEIFKGPNPRHNVLGYVYIGFPVSMIFSFIIGFLLSYVRNRLILKLGSGPLSLVLFGSFYLGLMTIESDFFNAMSALYNLIFLVILIGVLHLSLRKRGGSFVSVNNCSGI